MSRRSPNAGLGGRTQQAGTAVAATMMPLTFQRTLMPKSGDRPGRDHGHLRGAELRVRRPDPGHDRGGRPSPERGDLAGRGRACRRGGAPASRSTSPRSASGMRDPDALPAAAGRAAPPWRDPHGGLVDQRHRPAPAASSGSPRRSSAAATDREDRSVPVALPVGIVAGRGERVPPPALGGGRRRGRSGRGLVHVGGQVARHGARRDARAERRRRRRAPVRRRREQGPGEGPRQPRARVPPGRARRRAVRDRVGDLRDAPAGGPQDRARCRDARGGVRRPAHDVGRSAAARTAWSHGTRSAGRAAATSRRCCTPR